MKLTVDVCLLVIAAAIINVARIAAAAEPRIGNEKPVAVAYKESESGGKEEKVRDTVIPIETSYGTVILHESLNSGDRFAIAPKFRFLLLKPDNKVVARTRREAGTETVPVQLSIAMVHPGIQPELIRRLRDSGREVTITDVRNLTVDSLRVGVASAVDRAFYGVQDFVIPNPDESAEELPVDLTVLASKSSQFVEKVNAGEINFLITYSYNKVSVDSRSEMLSASALLDTQQVRELTQRGAELMSARQMAEASTNIKREIESKVIEGIGKIEPQSLPMDRLIQLFNVGATWQMTDTELREMDQRLLKQFDLKVDAKDFQPFRYQKKVIETLDKEIGIANKKKAYFDLYKREASSMKASAGLKIGPFGASGSYSKDFEEKMNSGNMSDDDFREHIKAYHGAEYTTEMVLERGVDLYDVQKVRALGAMRIVTVTLKPTLGSGLRNITLTPDREAAVYEDRRYVTLEDHLRDLDAKVKQVQRISIETIGDVADGKGRYLVKIPDSDVKGWDAGFKDFKVVGDGQRGKVLEAWYTLDNSMQLKDPISLRVQVMEDGRTVRVLLDKRATPGFLIRLYVACDRSE